MSDIIRVDLTPEEAGLVADLLTGEAVKYGVTGKVFLPEWHVLAKVLKAQLNPLNGPTFSLESDKARVDGYFDAISTSSDIADDEIPY